MLLGRHCLCLKSRKNYCATQNVISMMKFVAKWHKYIHFFFSILPRLEFRQNWKEQFLGSIVFWFAQLFFWLFWNKQLCLITNPIFNGFWAISTWQTCKISGFWQNQKSLQKLLPQVQFMFGQNYSFKIGFEKDCLELSHCTKSNHTTINTTSYKYIIQ